MSLAKLREPRDAMPGKPPKELQCTADSKRTGERCEAWAMTGRDTCYHHGGKSPVAAGSPHYKDGSRSKYRAIFSGDALEHYAWAREDPRYLEMREEMAVLDTLFVEELKRARVGGGTALWEELGSAWERFKAARPETDAATAGRCLRRVGELIEEGASRIAAQREALEIVERKRKLSETERRRIVDAERMITEAQAMSFVAVLGGIIRTHVTDQETLAAIHADIAKLVHQDLTARTQRRTP
ncbi:MAG: hypothetical protein M3R38_17360 [Actinomycetota bacterium]|nr:hypothetical protein [Actinomycetota bacterium]